jgi:phage tail sheath protein FI
MARVDTERGVHKAFANEVVMGIIGISQSINCIEQG